MEELLAERGIEVDPSRSLGWVRRLALLLIDAAQPLSTRRRESVVCGRDLKLRSRAGQFTLCTHALGKGSLLVQSLCRSHYELGVDDDPPRPLGG